MIWISRCFFDDITSNGNFTPIDERKTKGTKKLPFNWLQRRISTFARLHRLKYQLIEDKRNHCWIFQKRLVWDQEREDVALTVVIANSIATSISRFENASAYFVRLSMWIF